MAPEKLVREFPQLSLPAVYDALSYYYDHQPELDREMAFILLGAACPAGVVKSDSSLLDAVTAEWLVEVERIRLMLRLSQRLHGQYGD
ncbi:MAG: hypothetical protein ACUVXJ_00635 [Phycisphaerae bacterium]